MARPCTPDGKRNLISARLVELRKEHNLSQRELANCLQLYGIDMDKNAITRIETNKRLRHRHRAARHRARLQRELCQLDRHARAARRR